MFKHTSSQRQLFGVEMTMSPAKLTRLKKSWAHKYQQHALPLIDEEPNGISTRTTLQQADPAGAQRAHPQRDL